MLNWQDYRDEPLVSRSLNFALFSPTILRHTSRSRPEQPECGTDLGFSLRCSVTFESRKLICGSRFEMLIATHPILYYSFRMVSIWATHFKKHLEKQLANDSVFFQHRLIFPHLLGYIQLKMTVIMKLEAFQHNSKSVLWPFEAVPWDTVQIEHFVHLPSLNRAAVRWQVRCLVSWHQGHLLQIEVSELWSGFRDYYLFQIKKDND